MKSWVLIFSVLLSATAAVADSRHVNKIRKNRHDWNLVESVAILDVEPERPYTSLGTVSEFDTLTKRDEHLITIMRYKAAKVRADALLDVKCDTSRFRTKICTAEAIRWQETAP